MFLRIPTKKSMKNYSDEIIHLKEKLDKADAVVIGAGAGLSTAAGFTYAGERFEKHFSDFKQKYGFTDMYSGGFYPFETLEEYWAYWSRYIYINRYMDMVYPRPGMGDAAQDSGGRGAAAGCGKLCGLEGFPGDCEKESPIC